MLRARLRGGPPGLSLEVLQLDGGYGGNGQIYSPLQGVKQTVESIATLLATNQPTNQMLESR